MSSHECKHCSEDHLGVLKNFEADNARLEAEVASLKVQRLELLRACKAVLFFYHGRWPEDAKEWEALTGKTEATTKILCDCIRNAIANQVCPSGHDIESMEG